MNFLKLQTALMVLSKGGVIGYPTESVWGLGCDPLNQDAVSHLLKIKRRSVTKGLILVAASVDQFMPYLEGLSPAHLAKFSAPRDQPCTWILPANNYAPKWITGDYTSVALRVSAHKQTAELCHAFGGPLVSTSANLAGHAPAYWPWQLHRLLSRGLDYILPGALSQAGKPSEIRDLITDKIYRVGS
jgi:L-threonylcarbamoyladenylate synthase